MKTSCQKNSCCIQVRVQPNAKHEGWCGLWNGTHWKIALKAPAVDGKANEALIEFLAHYTKLPKRSFKLLAGQTSRSKIIEIQGVSSFTPPAQND